MPLFYDFKYHSAVLSTSRISVSHTAENIASVLNKILCQWDIKTKVTDNAPNMIKVCHCDSLRLKHLPCFAHTLNLVVQDALKQKECSSVFKKCKEIVTYVKQSNHASENLRKQQREMNKPELKLKNEVPTRWNSALYMMKRLLEVHDPLIITLSNTTNAKAPHSLTADDVLILREVTKLLDPFEVATRKLSGEYITVSIVIPIAFEVYNEVIKVEVNIETAKGMKKTLIEGVKLRLFPYEERTTCRLATLLDPRLEKEAFQSNENCKAAVTILQNELPSHVKNIHHCSESGLNETDAEDTKKREEDGSIQFSFMEDRLREKKRTRVVNTIILLRQYLERPNASSDPLIYWKLTGEEFLLIQRCALKYLCAPATSVPAERLFSKAGLVISDRRCSITPKHVDMLLFLNQNK
ncbi:E3 SUMO-protein ligase ZBED1-like [Anabrus simplex]|uniref:E3 SUMO-protein ligase ZBED1-like n=1 Tax=Anabrus simplex TaxID=316456 RepID=UPI0035A30083